MIFDVQFLRKNMLEAGLEPFAGLHAWDFKSFEIN